LFGVTQDKSDIATALIPLHTDKPGSEALNKRKDKTSLKNGNQWLVKALNHAGGQI
jgi:hypothetical protein